MTPLKPRDAGDLVCLFRRRQHAATKVPEAPLDVAEVMQRYGRARLRTLRRTWLQEGDQALWSAQSPTLRDHLQTGRGQVEFLALNRQYPSAQPTRRRRVNTPFVADAGDNLLIRGCPHPYGPVQRAPSTVMSTGTLAGGHATTATGSTPTIGRRFLPPVKKPRRSVVSESRGVNDPALERAKRPRADPGGRYATAARR